MVCLICQKKVKSFFGLVKHLRIHREISLKEYYDTYLRKDGEGICPECGGSTTFFGIKSDGKSYGKFCSCKCSSTNRFKNNNKEYYNTNLRKDGEGICPECGKETSFINVIQGYKHYCSGWCAGKSQTSIEKIKKTKKERYGNENYCNQEKIVKTFKKKYGVSNVFQSEHFKQIMTEEKQQERNLHQRQSFERIGKWVSLERKSEFEKYERIVWRETKKWKRELFEQWDGKDFYTGERLVSNEGFKKKNPDKHINTNPRQPSIDHKVEIIKGFNQGISAEEIGHIDNLCICSKSSNTKKRWGKI